MRKEQFTAAERFWQKVKVGQPDECWVWVANCNSNGYGRLRIDGTLIYAHRISWILTCGRIPDGQCVLHRCDNPKCVNPNHLFLGTHTDNANDMWAKGRGAIYRPFTEKERAKWIEVGLSPVTMGHPLAE